MGNMIHKVLPVQAITWRKNIRQYRRFNQDNKNEGKRFAEILAAETTQTNDDRVGGRK